MDENFKFTFDLDDTLYAERDYVRSALDHVGGLIAETYGIADSFDRLYSLWRERVADPIGQLWDEQGLPANEKAHMIETMRAHRPSIALRPDAARFLRQLRTAGRSFAIVTDGRSVTQRAKIAALGCDDARYVSVSEEVNLAKTDINRFAAVERALGDGHHIYVADNPVKDFLAPNLLGWSTVMLDNLDSGVHPQTFPSDPAYHPKVRIGSFDELPAAISAAHKDC